MYEVIELATGAAMSHMKEPAPGKPPDVTGTTLFATPEKALAWLVANDLEKTHEVREVRHGKT